jgi:hypothetical protein
MKKNILAITGALAIVAGSLGYTGFSNSGGPPLASSGAPGEQTCAGCHGITESDDNSGAYNNQLTLNGAAPEFYTPGETYNVTLTINGPRSMRGFQMTCINAEGNQAGSFTAGAGTRLGTSSSSGNNRQYISHSARLSGSSVNFTWTAPATNVGPVDFFVAGFNGNSRSEAQARVTKTQWSVSPEQVQSVKSANITNLNVYPNPITTSGKVSYTLLESTKVRINLFSLDGKVISDIATETQDAGKHELTFAIPAYVPSGTYFIQVKAGTKTAMHRVVKK